MDDKTFANWQNHLPATPLYSSGRSNHASISLQLAPSAKRYYLVVNNRTSARPQIMQARLNLAYRIRYSIEESIPVCHSTWASGRLGRSWQKNSREAAPEYKPGAQALGPNGSEARRGEREVTQETDPDKTSLERCY